MRTYRDVIKNKFENRLKKNPRYSLRAFARDLEVPVSRLSEVLNDKSGLSVFNAEKIAKKLDLSANEKELFLNQVLSEHGRSNSSRKNAKKYLSEIETKKLDFVEIDLDTFNIISDWYHYALIDLIETQTFKNDSEWMAKRLGINKFQVDQALERLKKCKLIEVKNRKLKAINQTVATSSDIPSEAIKNFHRQVLQKAIEAIDFQGVEERDMTTITVPLDTRLIPELKNKIKNFRREINNWVKEANKKPQEVYCLNLNLFSLTKNRR